MGSSPFGEKRSAAIYYEYGGVPHHYVAQWTGMPQPATRGAGETRSLGRYLPTGADFLDVSATFHKELSDYDIDYPVSVSMEAARRSILHSGPEQTRIHDQPTPPELGFFGEMSRNEKKLALVGGIALAGWLAWRHLR